MNRFAVFSILIALALFSISAAGAISTGINQPTQAVVIGHEGISIEGTANESNLSFYVEEVRLRIQNLDVDGSGYTTVVPWTSFYNNTNPGLINWNYDWNTTALMDGVYRLQVQAKRNGLANFSGTSTIVFSIGTSLSDENTLPVTFVDNVFFLNGTTPMVRVFGHSSNPTSLVNLELIDLESGATPQTSLALSTISSSTDANGYFTVDWDASGWDANHLLGVRLVETTTTYTPLDGFALYHAEQYLDEIQSAINDLNAVDANLQSQINQLNADAASIANKIQDLDANLSAVWLELNDLDARVDDLWSMLNAMNHITLNYHYSYRQQVLTIWGEAPEGANKVYLRIASLDGSFQSRPPPGEAIDVNLQNNNYLRIVNVINYLPRPYNIVVTDNTGVNTAGAFFDGMSTLDLNKRLTQLQNQVNQVNVGNLSFNYNTVTQTVRFMGEVPAGTNCVQLSAYSTDGTLQATAMLAAGSNPSGADYVQDFNTVGWPNVTVNAFAAFYPTVGCTGSATSTVSDSFDSLLGEDLYGFQNVILNTYTSGKNLPVNFNFKPKQTKNYQFVYQVDTNNWKPILGCKPYQGGNRVALSGYVDLNVPGVKKVTLGAMACDTNTNDFMAGPYTINYVLSAGFSGILSNTFTSSRTIPVNYYYKSAKKAMYRVLYRVTDENGSNAQPWKTLNECISYTIGQNKRSYGIIDLVNGGLRRVQLRAQNCDTNSIDSTSSPFVVQYEIPAFSFLEPSSNSNMSNPFPVGSIVDHVYWTQPGKVSLKVLIVSTLRSQCTLGYYRNNQDTSFHYIAGTDASGPLADSNYMCDFSQGIETNDWNFNRNPNPTNGYYTRIVMSYTHPAGSVDQNIGVDGKAPVINSINPNAASLLNGNIIMDVNVTDDLSGVQEVWIRVFSKTTSGDNNVLLWADQADFNLSKMKWEVDFNTLLIADGNYNVDVNAKDGAGNESSEFIDPVVDNTPPVINWVSVNPRAFVVGQDMRVDANVSDNLTGIDHVRARLTHTDLAGSSTVIGTYGLVADGNDLFHAIIPTDNNWSTDGYYELTVDANDRAGNDAFTNQDFNQSNPITGLLGYTVGVTLDNGTKTQGENATLTIYLTDGLHQSVGDVNVTVSSALFATTVVTLDNNGKGTYTFSAFSTGDFNIQVDYNANGYWFSSQALLHVNAAAAPTTSGGGGGGSSRGGGGGGGSRPSALVNSSTDSSTDRNETTGNDTEGENTPTDLNSSFLTPDSSEVEPIMDDNSTRNNATPTGFFGLGNAGSVLIGLIALLLLVGGFFVARRLRG